jgi:ABC-type polysaccharide/polyol phosphate export permease
MRKILTFFKSASPLLLLLVSIGIGIVAKLIEKKFTDIAMGLQTITFVLFVYAFIKFFDSKFKK